MKIPKIAMLLAGLLLAVAVAAAARAGEGRVEEVQIEHNGLTANADLYLAEGKTVADGVVLLTHATLQHNRMETIRMLAGLFRDSGYNVLAMTYSAGVDNRRGPYDCAVPHRHSIEDYGEEIRLWLDWIKEHGAKEIILAGHSGAGSWMAYYANHHDDPTITKMVLFAPGTTDHTGRSVEGYRARFRKDLLQIMDRAEALVRAGKGDTMMEDTDFLFCPQATVTAATFLSYYEQDRVHGRLLPRIMQELRKPTLVIGASDDNIAPDMTRMVEPFVDGERLRMVVLDGCGHFFRDLCADDAVEAAVAFLEEEG